MAKLTAFIEAQQLSFDIESAIAEAEAEIRAENPQTITTAAPIVATNAAGSGTDLHSCEVEALCHRLSGVNGRYVCGWIGAGTVMWCAKRRRLLEVDCEKR